MNLRIWGWGMRGYKLTLTNLAIWGCESGRIQASTHEPDDIRMHGCKQGHMNLRIWGCNDARIQASAHEHKDMLMRRCKDTSKCTGAWGYEDVRMWEYKQVKHIKHVDYFWVTLMLLQFTLHQSIYSIRLHTSNGINLIIFWCTIHQALPKSLNNPWPCQLFINYW